MSYVFRQDESPAESVRRVAREQLEAIDLSLSKMDSSFAKPVHDARRDLKKLRALLRLVRDALGKKVFRRENEAVRDAGRALGDLRDRWVKYGLVKQWREKEGVSQLNDETLNPLEKSLRNDYKKLTSSPAAVDAVANAKRALEGLSQRINDWPIDDREGFDLFRQGVEAVYSRCRKQMQTAMKRPTACNLHQWRKHCKNLRYHIELLHPSFPEMLSVLQEKLHELTNHLGDHQDLAVLQESLPDDLEKDLLRDIKKRRKALAKDSFVLGELLFADEPEAFAARLETYWNTWKQSGD